MIIRQGFADRDRAKVADLFWAAFGSKLRIGMGPSSKALKFLAANLNPEFAIAAYDGDQLAGVAGFKTDAGGLLGGDLRAFAAVYGWPSALWRGPILDLLDRPLAQDTLLMDGIFVDPPARGQGVGTALLSAIKSHAADLGKIQVRLDVVAENPRAKALYHREGFQDVATTHSLIGRMLFGISGSTEMVFVLPN